MDVNNIYAGSAQYVLIYVFAVHDADHEGFLKIGEHSFESTSSFKQLPPNCDELNNRARHRISQYSHEMMTRYELLHTELARKQIRLPDGTIEAVTFSDRDVHQVLDRSGYLVKRFYETDRPSEWYQVDLETAKAAITAVKEGKSSIASTNAGQQSLFAVEEKQVPQIVLRDEQNDCIAKTTRVFRKSDRMLWDCKMRFGKTVTAYSLVKAMDLKKVLVVTHRPAVVDGWSKDFQLIFPEGDREFCVKANMEYEDRFNAEDAGIDAENNRRLKALSDAGKPFVYFASMQDLRGSKLIGGKFDKNRGVFEMDWDIIIYDEAHEGTQTELAKRVQDLLEKTKDGKAPKKILQLSGTPYNLLKQYDDDNVYSWDYVMEQKRKHEWDEKYPNVHNPYADLPEMRICTFDLRNSIANSYRYEDESVAFNFREFFRTWTGDPQKDFHPLPAGARAGDFVHAADVREFLNLISTESTSSNYPFATPEYRDMFKHTFWILPGVKEARAFSAMLKQHDVFRNYEIVNVAGEGDVEQPYDDALRAVQSAIETHDRTITLSCGKLTTGVTVKKWTAVMLLSGSASTGAAGYMQTIFRVQSAGSIDGKQKKICYAFDFAPDRALRVLSDVHSLRRTAKGSDDAGRAQLREFLNFCPVIAQTDTGMEFYDVPKMMRQIKRLTVEQAIKSGFEDDSIYKADAGIVFTAKQAALAEKLKAKLDPQKKSKKQTHVLINEQGMTAEEYAKAEKAKNKPKKERTKEEQEVIKKQQEAKKQQQGLFDLLRNVSIRLPLLIYGTQKDFDESIRLKDFVTIVDKASWKEFMPQDVTPELFLDLLEFYDEDVIEGAGMRIRRMAKAADELMPTQRVMRIAEIFSYFKNPAKETVLTPWRVVNMHLGDTIGGYNFYKEGYPQQDGILESPRLIDNGQVTEDLFLNENVKILEMNSKSGLYPLYVAYSIYRILIPSDETSLSLQEAQKVWQDVLQNHLYVLCQTEMAVSITKRTLAGYTDTPVRAIFLTKLLDRMEDRKRLARKLTKPELWGQEGEKMKFDAIVGNPPYQSDEGGVASQPIYHHFMDEAKELCPDYISMITPSRWMTATSGVLVDYRKRMVEDGHIECLVDYLDATFCFPTVEIKGGLCYYLWNKNHAGNCHMTSIDVNGMRNTIDRTLNTDGVDVIIRDGRKISILKKVMESGDSSFMSLVSANDPFGFDLREDHSSKRIKPSYTLERAQDDVPFYYNGWRKDGVGYVPKSSIRKGQDFLSSNKVFIPKAWGTGNVEKDWLNPFIPENDAVCTETYLMVGPFDTAEITQNVVSYMQTRFFHMMVSVVKSTQNTMQQAYAFVPTQDFSKTWTDAMLYAKYGLNEDEIAYIENTIRAVE